MSELPARVAALLQDLSEITDPADRADFLIECSDRFVEVPAEIATRPFLESHRVPGCESEAFAWVSSGEGGRYRLHFAVENPQGVSARAFAVLLCDCLDDSTAAEILSVPRELVYDIFGRGIAMGKGQGLMGMLLLAQSLVRASEKS